MRLGTDLAKKSLEPFEVLELEPSLGIRNWLMSLSSSDYLMSKNYILSLIELEFFLAFCILQPQIAALFSVSSDFEPEPGSPTDP